MTTAATRDDDVRVQELLAENARLKTELAVKTRETARALASYQQRALQMEIIRQQNEDLDRLASDLATAKRAEESRGRDIEAAARLQREFLASFSHEIRTPLNGIIGYCELLLQEEGSRLSPHGRRDMGVIKSNARALLTLINDILTLSKIEGGRVDVARETLDMRSVLDDCLTTVREVTKAHEVELTSDVHDDARTAHSDAQKVRQILLNLLANAAKFTEGGEIGVHVRAEGASLVLEVHDTGAGLAPEDVVHAFDKFRVDASGARRGVGTGLGLAIVRELARVLGGTTEVRSALGRGSTFTVKLPGCVEPRAASPAPETATAPTPKPRETESQTGVKRPAVLVVDDDVAVQTQLREALEREGFAVLVAADGATALRMARERAPAAVFLETVLPRIDGWNVLSELKGDPKLARVPVVLLSKDELRARGCALGAWECLLKPLDTARALDVLRRATAPLVGDVLVVDDDAVTRELVCRNLQKAGMRTSQARDGEDALLRLRISKPGLVITDLEMPNMSGFELLRRVRGAGIAVPILVLTGKELTSSEEQVLREGRVHVVAKGELALEEIVREATRVLSLAREARSA